ncbi:MAG: glycosyltransferase family 2 protein [Pseudomonadota bacterium]
MRVAVIIPALNEAEALPHVIEEIPDWVDEIIVADNGSTDGTVNVARNAGAHVVTAPAQGYGHACMAGIKATDADVCVFLDGDHSDYPEQMDRLVTPIRSGDADIVIGSRVLGHRARGALTPQQRWGNALACRLIRWLWGHRYTDLGPFRAVRREALIAMNMTEMRYGWTVEMQIKAIEHGLNVAEAPTDYRTRIGKSKISGTVQGVIKAGSRILFVIARSWWARRTA